MPYVNTITQSNKHIMKLEGNCALFHYCNLQIASLAKFNSKKTVAILGTNSSPQTKTNNFDFFKLRHIRGLSQRCLTASQEHTHPNDGLAAGSRACQLAWSSPRTTADMLLFVLLRISRKFLWVFYVTRVGSTEKLYPPVWYFWKENSKLLEEGVGEQGGQERKEWVRIKKVPSGKSRTENWNDGKWDFLLLDKEMKVLIVSDRQKKVWITSQCLPICGPEFWQSTVKVITGQEFPFQ